MLPCLTLATTFVTKQTWNSSSDLLTRLICLPTHYGVPTRRLGTLSGALQTPVSFLAASECEDDVIQSGLNPTETSRREQCELCSGSVNPFSTVWGSRDLQAERVQARRCPCGLDCHAKPAEQRQQWSGEQTPCSCCQCEQRRRWSVYVKLILFWRTERAGGRFLLWGAAMTSPPGSCDRDGEQNQQQMWQFPFKTKCFGSKYWLTKCHFFHELLWGTPRWNVTKYIYSTTGLQNKLRNLLHSILHFLLHYFSPAFYIK